MMSQPHYFRSMAARQTMLGTHRTVQPHSAGVRERRKDSGMGSLLDSFYVNSTQATYLKGGKLN